MRRTHRTLTSSIRMLGLLAALLLLASPAIAHHGGLDRLPSLRHPVPGKMAPPALRERPNVGSGGNVNPGNISNPMPEPTAILVFGAGLVIAGLAVRRRNRS